MKKSLRKGRYGERNVLIFSMGINTAYRISDLRNLKLSDVAIIEENKIVIKIGRGEVMNMLKLYSNYWKNIFNYKGHSNLKELVCAIFLNFVFLSLVYLIGLFWAPSLENTIVNLFYLILVIMIFPTVSLLVRLIKSYI
ncbi:site-specific integrase [Enterococcus faecalis]